MNWIMRCPVGICWELETWLVVWEKNLKPDPGEGERFLGCGILRAKTREVSGKPGHVGHPTYCTWIANLFKHRPLTKPSPVKQLGTFDSDLEVQGDWFLHSLCPSPSAGSGDALLVRRHWRGPWKHLFLSTPWALFLLHLWSAELPSLPQWGSQTKAQKKKLPPISNIFFVCIKAFP